MNYTRSLFEMCDLMFREPERLYQVHCHRHVESPWVRQPHAHDDELQMDFISGFSGTITIGEQKVTSRNAMAFVAYPDTPHGYDLAPLTPLAVNYSIKIKLPETILLTTERNFPEIECDLPNPEQLRRSLEQLYRLNFATTLPHPLVICKLCEVLLLWPNTSPLKMLKRFPLAYQPERDEQIMTAITMIDRNLVSPPQVEELAHTVCLSRRQFFRRFVTLTGMSPHEYVAKQRVTRAQELLSEANLSITKVAEALGFETIHSFSRWFHTKVGISPSGYQKQAGVP